MMEIYNKEKHHDLVMEHMKQAALENASLDMYPRLDNDGNGFVELVINETDSIFLKGKDFEYFQAEANAFAFHDVMTNYIAPADKRTKDQLFVRKTPQEQTSLNYWRWNPNLKLNKEQAQRLLKAKEKH